MGTNRPTARGIIADLYEYGAWANERLLARAEMLSDAQLRQKLSEGAQPILESFVHLLSADRRWLARWQEVPLPAGLTPVDLPTIAAVRRAGEDLALARQQLYRRPGRRGARGAHPLAGRLRDAHAAPLAGARPGCQPRDPASKRDRRDVDRLRALPGRPRLRTLVPDGGPLSGRRIGMAHRLPDPGGEVRFGVYSVGEVNL